MNKSYIIAPLILIVAFIAYFVTFNEGYQKQLLQKEQARIQAENDKLAEKKRQQDLAAIENKKQADLKAAEEQKKLDEKKARQNAADQKIRDETSTLATANKANSEKKAQLETDLADARRAREKAEREAFEAAKDVELMKIQRRTAEFEIQRAAEFIANKVDATSLVEVPVFAEQPKTPAPAAAK